MKVLVCMDCSDIVAPYREDGKWRRCQCGRSAVTWTSGNQGLLLLSHKYNRSKVRVLGLNNAFFITALEGGITSAETWRMIHQASIEEVEPHYLFHKNNRACWACVIAVGETGDVTFIAWEHVHD